MPIRKETLPVRDTPIVVSAASVSVCLLITVPSVPYASPQLVRSVQLSIPLRTVSGNPAIPAIVQYIALVIPEGR